MKILFQGDSITDAGRGRPDAHELGSGYPKYAAERIRRDFPDVDFEFINLGISGNRVENLVERLQTDFVDVGADIVSIMIGINDVWHRSEGRKWLPNDIFEEQYRTVLEAVKKTGAKIMIIEPYLVPGTEKDFFREDLDGKIDVIRSLAREYADVYMPLDGLFASAFIGDDPLSFSADGVHPIEKGCRFIGENYAKYIERLIVNS